MSLRDKLRRLERAAEVNMIVVPQSERFGGGVAKFPERALVEAQVSSFARLRAHGGDEPLPEPHPLLDALYRAPAGVVEELASIHGSGVSFLAGEEEVFRGDVERASLGPPAEWDGEGKVCG